MKLDNWNALKKKAMSGDFDAEFEVGLIYEEGLSDDKGKILVEQNLQRAVFWYRKAAEHGNSSAQNNLGYCLDKGRGVKKNKEEALFWYKKAYNNNEPCAANNIATIYREKGKNRRAFFWYNRAIEMNDGDSLIEVGKGYYYGIGVRRNYQLAIEYYKRAINSTNITEAGREDAKYCLGLAFYEGNGVNRSIPQAIKWFKSANIDNDHNGAKAMLSKITDGKVKRKSVSRKL